VIEELIARLRERISIRRRAEHFYDEGDTELLEECAAAIAQREPEAEIARKGTAVSVASLRELLERWEARINALGESSGPYGSRHVTVCRHELARAIAAEQENSNG